MFGKGQPGLNSKEAAEFRCIRQIPLLSLYSFVSAIRWRLLGFIKQKRLIKKIRRLEARLQKRATKLANLKRKLRAMEAAKFAKAKSKSVTVRQRRLAMTAPIPQGTSAGSSLKKVKKNRHITPERRAQLAAAMKARWAAKRAAEASATAASAHDRHSPQDSTPRTPKLAPALAAVRMPPETARRIEPSDEEIRLRAYFISKHRRRCVLPGDADSDWREARQQLLSE